MWFYDITLFYVSSVVISKILILDYLGGKLILINNLDMLFFCSIYIFMFLISQTYLNTYIIFI